MTRETDADASRSLDRARTPVEQTISPPSPFLAQQATPYPAAFSLHAFSPHAFAVVHTCLPPSPRIYRICADEDAIVGPGDSRKRICAACRRGEKEGAGAYPMPSGLAAAVLGF